MNVLNRSAITITYKKPFIDWNNALFPDLPIHENMLGESKTYLINEIFNNAGDVIKKRYKEIFETELEGICIDENEWPAKRNLKSFNEWFSYEISDWVMDLSKRNMFG
jgi:adenylate cyclase class IV